MKIQIELSEEILRRIKRSTKCHQIFNEELEENCEPGDYIEMLIDEDLEFIEGNFVVNIHGGQIRDRDALHKETVANIAEQLGIQGKYPEVSADIEINIRLEAWTRMEKDGWKLLADVAP